MCFKTACLVRFFLFSSYLNTLNLLENFKLTQVLGLLLLIVKTEYNYGTFSKPHLGNFRATECITVNSFFRIIADIDNKSKDPKMIPMMTVSKLRNALYTLMSLGKSARIVMLATILFVWLRNIQETINGLMRHFQRTKQVKLQ